jgi:Tfp pilus assembly protein PilO
VGEYHAVARFLTDVASLARIITPVELEVELYGSPDFFPELESPIQASFRIETYVLPEAVAAPAPAPPGD